MITGLVQTLVRLIFFLGVFLSFKNPEAAREFFNQHSIMSSITLGFIAAWWSFDVDFQLKTRR